VNIITTIGHDAKIVGEDVIKGIEYPVTFLIKAGKVIASAIKDQPQIKAAVLELIQQAEGVVGDVASAASTKGLNLASDARALADAGAFFSYFKDTFIPLVEQVYTEVAADLQ
jgi:hypothetical protein